MAIIEIGVFGFKLIFLNTLAESAAPIFQDAPLLRMRSEPSFGESPTGRLGSFVWGHLSGRSVEGCI